MGHIVLQEEMSQDTSLRLKIDIFGIKLGTIWLRFRVRNAYFAPVTKLLISSESSGVKLTNMTP